MKIFKIGTSTNYGGCIAFGKMKIVNEDTFFEQLNHKLKTNNLEHLKKDAIKIGNLRKGVSISGIFFLITNK